MKFLTPEQEEATKPTIEQLGQYPEWALLAHHSLMDTVAALRGVGRQGDADRMQQAIGGLRDAVEKLKGR